MVFVLIKCREYCDIECSQKMIDDLLKSIKNETKNLTNLQNSTMGLPQYKTPSSHVFSKIVFYRILARNS